ncbi:PREDICTED: uncharacterized protein LOC105558531 isoform X2 [Vollenhovia emeryi]|nr:PREDICTED: uncharacterized protein LOC105558531 isoform X2 [Vollenhovia emeryi]
MRARASQNILSWPQNPEELASDSSRICSNSCDDFPRAKCDKSDSYTSKPVRTRVYPKCGDFDNKAINTVEVQRNGDSDRSKLKVRENEYWSNVLRNQWLLALQGIVIVIVILTMGTWIGHECKEDIVEDGPLTLWRLFMERFRETIVNVGTELR